MHENDNTSMFRVEHATFPTRTIRKNGKVSGLKI